MRLLNITGPAEVLSGGPAGERLRGLRHLWQSTLECESGKVAQDKFGFVIREEIVCRSNIL